MIVFIAAPHEEDYPINQVRAAFHIQSAGHCVIAPDLQRYTMDENHVLDDRAHNDASLSLLTMSNVVVRLPGPDEQACAEVAAAVMLNKTVCYGLAEFDALARGTLRKVPLLIDV